MLNKSKCPCIVQYVGLYVVWIATPTVVGLQLEKFPEEIFAGNKKA